MPKRSKYGNYGMWQFGGETNLIRSNIIGGLVCDQNYAYKNYPEIIKNKSLNNFAEEINDNKLIDDELPNNEETKENIIDEETKVETKESIITIIFSVLKKLINFVLDKIITK